MGNVLNCRRAEEQNFN